MADPSKSRALFISEIAPPPEELEEVSNVNPLKIELRTRTRDDMYGKWGSEPWRRLCSIISTVGRSGNGEARSSKGEACAVVGRNGRSKIPAKRAQDAPFKTIPNQGIRDLSREVSQTIAP
jgi:hypothetical protein